MGPRTAQQRSIDVTGLPESAIVAVEQFVAHLRGQQAAVMPPAFDSPQEWVKALREWAEAHPTRDTLADDRREAIYSDE
jgi:hypothetical protein